MTGWLVVYLACLLPFVTHWRYASAAPFDAVTQTPLVLFAVGGLVLVGLEIAKRDRWLGVFVAYMAVNALRVPIDAKPLQTAALIAGGALALVAVRELSAHHRMLAARALVVVGLVQVVVAVGQWYGVDVYWPGGLHLERHVIPGTLGNSAWLGAYLAMVAPLAVLLRGGWGAVALVTGALVLVRSSTGLLAALAGILTCIRDPWVRRIVLPLGACGALLVVVGWPGHFSQRAAMWWLGLHDMVTRGDWLVWLCGWGPGAWAARIPALQRAMATDVAALYEGYYVQAHNEVVQLLFEGGVIALALLGTWLWTHRQAFGHGGFVAVATVSLALFPFHVAQLAAPAVVILGVATAKENA